MVNGVPFRKLFIDNKIFSFATPEKMITRKGACYHLLHACKRTMHHLQP